MEGKAKGKKCNLPAGCAGTISSIGKIWRRRGLTPLQEECVNGYIGTDSILVHNKTKVKYNPAVDILNKADFVESVVQIKAETNIIVTLETGSLAYGIPLVNYIFGKSDMKKMQLGPKRATS